MADHLSVNREDVSFQRSPLRAPVRTVGTRELLLSITEVSAVVVERRGVEVGSSARGAAMFAPLS